MTIPRSNGKTVLISGINGYIASSIGLEFLKKGYTLRGTARATKGMETLQRGAYEEYGDRFEMRAVPDITVPGAFDDAVKGTVLVVVIQGILDDLLMISR